MNPINPVTLLSQKATQVEPSATIAITALAKKMKAEGHNVLSFSAGEPDFQTPQAIQEAGISAIRDGKTTYTPAAGTIKIRQSICSKIERELGLAYTPENVIVSCGAKHAIYTSLLALCNPGDEVIIPSPYWVSYPDQVRLADGVPVIVRTHEEDGFKLDADQLKNAITPRTKAILLNSPSNPTGSVYTQDELTALAQVIQDHNIIVISDEIYAKLVYDTAFTSIATLPGMQERTLIIDGASKSYAMTGWRIGYTAGPKPIISAMSRIQSHATSNAATPSQWAATTAFNGDDTEINRMKEAFNERRLYMVKRLNAIEGITCQEPKGAFYAFPNVSALFGRPHKNGVINNSFDLCEILLQEQFLACVPGSAFGAEGYLRMSYATSMDIIKEGLDRLEAWVG